MGPGRSNRLDRSRLGDMDEEAKQHQTTKQQQHNSNKHLPDTYTICNSGILSSVSHSLLAHLTANLFSVIFLHFHWLIDQQLILYQEYI